jgi:hypothetical protein
MPYEAKMARMVLEDCRYALTELRNDPQGPAWRVRWFGTLAMLRTVGYVLDKEDAKSCPEMREAIDASWKKLRRKAIFRQFIKLDRDAIVHQYDHRAGQGVIITPGFAEYNRIGQTITTGGPTTYTYKIHGGPFDGQDPRDVVQKVIEWWDQEVTKIETDARRRAVAGSSAP